MPASAASCTASATRSSALIPMATCSAVAGTPARRHSTTGLRPSTVSAVSPSPALRRLPATLPRLWFSAALAASLALRAAGWYGRSSFGGVGPLPCSCLRR
jgi:hypothetical protein